jgi:GxxExxY protein
MIFEEKLSYEIVGCAFKVYNTLGKGFLEKVYEKALMIELSAKGFNVKLPQALNVYYNQKAIGEFFADIIVENKVILELKAVEKLIKIHEAQLINYLKASNIKVGYLLNFGNSSKLEYKRFVY